MHPEQQRVIKLELPKDEVYREKTRGLLYRALVILLVAFIISNLSCLALFFLNGFQITVLSDQALVALVAATLGEAAGLITMIIKRLVPES